MIASSTSAFRHPRRAIWSFWLPILFPGLLVLGGIAAKFGFASQAALAIEAGLILVLTLSIGPSKRAIVSIAIFGVLLMQLFMAANSGTVHWQDFFRAIKPWFYLALLFSCPPVKLLVGRQWLPVVYVFAFFYVVALLSGDSRPRLLVENNFEVPLVLSIYSALVISGGVELRSRISAVVALIVLLSMSRSGVAAYAVVMALLVFREVRAGRMRGQLSWRRVGTYSWLVVGAVVVIAYVFTLRADSLDSIDRVAFFRTFWPSWLDLGIVNQLVGAGALTELPTFACYEHAFYLEALAGHEGQCYSVVWHASVFRLVFDFGVVGFAVLYMGYYWVLRRRYSIYDALIGIAPAFVVGFSVGGIYNYLAVLGILIFYYHSAPGCRKANPHRLG